MPFSLYGSSCNYLFGMPFSLYGSSCNYLFGVPFLSHYFAFSSALLKAGYDAKK